MSFRTILQASLAFAFCALSLPGALIFDSGTTSLSVADPTQLGRISRNGVISDWSTVKPYPGTINAATTYHYHVFDVIVPSYFPFVQITMDSTSPNLFASAYLGTYNAASLGTNYLGDDGSSGNFFGFDPRAFQVVLSGPGDLLVVVNDAAASNGGLGQSFDVLVEAFSDTSFNETTPEPSTLALAGAGFIACAFLRRRIVQRG